MLWGMINVMQLIVHMPLFSVSFPSNAVLFYSFIIEISSFDILPTQWIKDKIFVFSNEQEPLTDDFDKMGYSSTSIIENLGSMFLYLMGFLCLVVFVLLIRFLKNRYKLYS